jgi:nucleoside-diphosphate-sugar epimerase
MFGADYSKNNNILITGATGFVGGHLVAALSEENNNVTVLVRKNSNLRYLNNEKIKIVYGDLQDKESLNSALKNVDIVIHSAGLMSDRDYASKKDFFKINVRGTENLITGCLIKNEIKQFIHISTVGVYGCTGKIAINESYGYGKSLSPYEWSKAEAEKIVLKYADRIPITILRLGQLYGPRMIYGWTNVIEMIYTDRMKIIGKGESLIHLTYIDDVVNGIKMAIGNEKCIGQIFNICSENIYKLSEVFQAIADTLGKPHPKSIPYYPVYILSCLLNFIPSFLRPKSLRLLTPHRVRFFKNNHIYDISKAKMVFGYNPAFNMQEGIKRMVEWYFSEFKTRKVY